MLLVRTQLNLIVEPNRYGPPGGRLSKMVRWSIAAAVVGAVVRRSFDRAESLEGSGVGALIAGRRGR